jgi:hypothetical protein
LPFAHTSNGLARTSPGETPFNDSFAVSEVLDSNIYPGAPKNGAVNQTFSDSGFGQTSGITRRLSPELRPEVERTSQAQSHAQSLAEIPVDRIVSRLRGELEPALRRMAREAAAGEHERTREWLESKGLPKAARVAQRETYDALRRQGFLKDAAKNSPADVGRGVPVSLSPRRLPEDEVFELAEACLALLEAKGQPVALTLSEMNVASGGFLLPEDTSRVLEKVEALLNGCRRQEGREVS